MIHYLFFLWTLVLLIILTRQSSPSHSHASTTPTTPPTASLPKQYVGLHAEPPPASSIVITDYQWLLITLTLLCLLCLPYTISYLQHRLWRPSEVLPVLNPIDSPAKTSRLPANVTRTRPPRRARSPSPPETALEQRWRRILTGPRLPVPLLPNGVGPEHTRRNVGGLGHRRTIRFAGEDFEESGEVSNPVECQCPRNQEAVPPVDRAHPPQTQAEEHPAVLVNGVDAAEDDDETWLREWGWPSSSSSGDRMSESPEARRARGGPRGWPGNTAAGGAVHINLEDAAAEFILRNDIPAPRRRQAREDYMDSLLEVPREYRAADYRRGRGRWRGRGKGKGRAAEKRGKE